MSTYTVTLTATFEAADSIDASEQFSEWLTNPSNIDNGVDISIDVESSTESATARLVEADMNTALFLRGDTQSGKVFEDDPTECVTCGMAYGEAGHGNADCDSTDNPFYQDAYQQGINAALDALVGRIDQLRHDLR